MLKTYQFKTHCKGLIHISKTANVIVTGLVIKQRWTPCIQIQVHRCWGVLASAGWREVWRPSPKVDAGAFIGQRQGCKTPKRTPLQCKGVLLGSSIFCVCSRSALLRDLLGVSRSREHDLLSVLSIYPRIFLCVFIVYCRVVRILFLLLYSAICWCVLVALVKLSVLSKWLAIERPLWWHLHEVRRLSPQSPGGRVCLCAFVFHLVCLCCYVFPPALHNIYFIRLWHNIAYMCWKCR